MTSITIHNGDITQLDVDVIVNAANPTLLGGGGVDGAIHAAAGSGLLAECKTLDGCRTGEAKITQGYKLPAKFVIHTVGPIFGQESGHEAELLASCYRSCLDLAVQHQLKSIAFPTISTGVYAYPKEQAAQIAVNTVFEWVNAHANGVEKIIFVTHSKEDKVLYQKQLQKS